MMKQYTQRWLRPQMMCGLFAAGLGLSAVLSVFTPTLRPVADGAQLPVIKVLTSSPARAAAKSQVRPHVNCAKVACVALTFDDGPSTEMTPRILDILERANTPATFFVIGKRVAGNEALLQRMYLDGDEIGNHTWDHPDLTTLSPQDVRAQIMRTQQAVTSAHVPAPRLFRPPYGAVNAVVKSQIPLTIAMWNVDPEDWKHDNAGQVASDVIAQARPGAVLELHDIHEQTAIALPTIIDTLKPRYQFVTFSELLNLTPNQPGEFFGR